jgi:mycofactocin precursor
VTNIGDQHQTRGADMADNPATDVADEATGDVVADEVLVEEVSIDGMCGVY